jgi:DNA-binding response OmpR family regulator
MTRVYLIKGQGDQRWVESLRKAVNSLGMSFLSVDHRVLYGNLQEGDLIILDAGAVRDDLGSIVRHIRATNPQIRIVVVSSAPHWREARQTLLAGATDYVRKANDQNGILDILHGKVPTLIKQ